MLDAILSFFRKVKSPAIDFTGPCVVYAVYELNGKFVGPETISSEIKIKANGARCRVVFPTGTFSASDLKADGKGDYRGFTEGGAVAHLAPNNNQFDLRYNDALALRRITVKY
jgi:hypothetical protein